MTPIFEKRIAAIIKETRFADITPNNRKSKMGASVKADFSRGGVS